MPEQTVRIGSVVIDCDDFETVRDFWMAALGYRPRESGSEGWVVLSDPSGRGPNVSINRSGEGPLAEYRLHLDLYTEAPEPEVERLVRLGARVVTPARAGADFAVLTDPGGNPFCVVDTRR
jgi:hypothetical protein